MIDWLNTNDGAVIGIATVALVLVTAAYVVLTYLLVREQGRQRVVASVPSISYEVNDDAELIVRNIGFGPAIQVSIDLRLEGHPGALGFSDDAELPDDLSPGQEARLPLVTNEDSGQDLPPGGRAWLPVLFRCVALGERADRPGSAA